MGKTKKKEVLVAAGILMIAGFFLGSSYLKGQARFLGKPTPPQPSYSWTVNLTEMPGLSNLWGGPFENGSTASINVSRQIMRDKSIVYSFYIAVFNTSPEKLHFQGVEFDPATLVMGEGTSCVFPDSGCIAPDCLATFINSQPHPREGYLKATIYFSTHFDIEEMGENSTWPLGEIDGNINIFLDAEAPYHDVIAHKNYENATLTRSGDTWTFNFGQKINFLESYTETVKKKTFVYHPITVDTLGNFVCQAAWTRKLIVQ